MSKILSSLVLTSLLSMGFVDRCGITTAPEIPAPAADPVAEKALNEILDRWEKKSAEIQTIQTEFLRADRSLFFDRVTHYEGTYVAKGAELALVSVREKGNAVDDVRILCTADRVYQFKNAIRQVFVWPKTIRKGEKVEAAGGKDDAFRTFPLMFSAAIQDIVQPDGPWFFFKIRGEDLKARYRIDLMPELPRGYHLRLVPKTKADRAEFSHVELMVDKETLLPLAVKVWAANGKETRLFTFKKTTINGEIADETFKPQIPEGWKVDDYAVEKPQK